MAKSLSVTALIIVILAAVVFVAFFLPWAHVEAQAVGMVSKALTGHTQSNIAAISGFDVPVMANGPDARLMMSIMQIFSPGIKNADKKSFLIWGVPLLALLLAAAAIFMGNNKLINLAIAVIGIAIFAVGVYKIKTTDLNKLVLNVRIGLGLWFVFLGYLGMGVAALANFVQLSKKK
jgi:hypothetical protein